MMQNNYNPDVLTCLANLSNDEVFTPPNLANQMLDTLPEKLWSNPKAKFFDPFCKSGIFLREIAKRLIKGLEDHEPDLQKRINHIMQNQLFGIGITELTALLTRRSLYCTKKANGEYAVATIFDTEDGHITYERIQHTFDKGKCTFCGASQDVYDRGDELETHAYQFIHQKNPFENMHFDVIIGNPPYQLSDGGAGASAIPLYHKFVQQALKLRPRYLSMIIPARWFAGGRGLDEFRADMLKDNSIRKIVDFHNAADCFPGVEIKGGVCYFLWNRDNKGDCEVVTVINGEFLKPMSRKLDDYDVFVRLNESIPILKKVLAKKEKSFSEHMSSQKPFGFRTNFRGFKKDEFNNSVKIYAFKEVGWIEKEKVTQNPHWIDEWKVIISRSYNGGYTYPHQIINRPILAEKGTCCTETYIVCDVLANEKRASNLQKYITTKFFRFLVFLRKVSQDNPKDRFAFVPLQNYDEEWTDKKLYKKYGLTQDEIDFIESMIRPMEL